MPMNAAIALPILLAIVAGSAMAVQAPTNAMLAKASGSTVVAAFISFTVGIIPLGVLVAATAGSRLMAPELRTLPWYAWLGGLYGVVFICVMAFAAPRLGVATLFAATVLGQMIAALILDHYGLFGLTQQPVNLQRIVGVALVLVGVIVVRRA